MVGHTGVIEAATKACYTVDNCVGKIAKACIDNDVTMLLTADHGNAEVMVNSETGKPQTAHTTNKVPFVVINAKEKVELKADGALCNIAPTVLKLLGIEQPAEMNCEPLIK
jgi:2,3-bisphosphoglycerate-independent phosphoglycerate mutase